MGEVEKFCEIRICPLSSVMETCKKRARGCGPKKAICEKREPRWQGKILYLFLVDLRGQAATHS
jgi:hypothetical protein